MVNKEQVLTNILIHLKKIQIDYPVALVGSATEKAEFNDLDLLMIVENVDNVRNLIINSFREYKTEVIDDAVKIVDYSECEISIALYSKEKVNRLINDFLTGSDVECNHRTWSIGYWICESFISNISKMIIVNDKEDYLLGIKNLTQKFSIYAKVKILLNCIEEIEIKMEMLKMITSDSIEYSFFKNDILLAVIRGIYISDNIYLCGFKRIGQLIENCSEIYKTLLLDFINNDNIASLTNIVQKLKKSVSWKNNLYLGTWQYSGDFKQLSEEKIIELLTYAKKMGIRKFDTALVYGNGSVEKILSKVLTDEDEVLTKIPAKIKPIKNEEKSIDNFYTFEYMRECITKSLNNLNRNTVDVCLLHNWSSSWNNNLEIIDWLVLLKKEGIVKKIGISLPNDYGGELPNNILEKIDVIEAPYNENNVWIVDSLKKYKMYGIEIILRSLFIQGKVLKDKFISVEKIIKEASSFETSLVIGMTTFEQIDNNIKLLRRKK